jgi:hypothetical protein
MPAANILKIRHWMAGGVITRGREVEGDGLDVDASARLMPVCTRRAGGWALRGPIVLFDENRSRFLI